MLSKFTVSNFKGFDVPVTFDLSKTRDYEFNNELVKNSIANKVIIYGKNGCGKTNLGLAVFDITQHMLDFGKREMIYENYLNYKNNKAAIFDYEFNFDGLKIRYTYEKQGYNILNYEKLTVNGEDYLSADYLHGIFEIYSSEEYLKGLNIPKLDSGLSLVKYIYSHSEKKEKAPITLLYNYVSKMLWFRSLDDGKRFIGFYNELSSMGGVIKNNKIKEFELFLKDNGVDYNLVAMKDGDKEILGVNFNGTAVPFGKIASSGTMALWLFFAWKIHFENVSFLFLDEFDAFYHYETSEYIVSILNKINSMQSVVTSHNTSLMNNRLTRPDCCFIMSDNNVTSLCDCTEKEIREAHNLEKMYRNGAFTE